MCAHSILMAVYESENIPLKNQRDMTSVTQVAGAMPGFQPRPVPSNLTSKPTGNHTAGYGV